MELNWLDLAILTIVCVSALFGFLRGFIGRALSLVAVLASLVLAFAFYDVAGELFIERGIVSERAVASVGGFVIVFFGSYVVFTLIGWLAKRLLEALSLGWLDKMAGALVGVVVGVLLSSVFVWALGFVIPKGEPPFTTSSFLPHIRGAMARLKESIPEDSKERLMEARDSVREKGKEIKEEVKEEIEGAVEGGSEEKGDGEKAESPEDGSI